jgi:hypothetical protein
MDKSRKSEIKEWLSVGENQQQFTRPTTSRQSEVGVSDYIIGRRYQTTTNGNIEDLLFVVVICRVCKLVKCNNYL